MTISNYKAFMTYLAPKDIARLKKFSKQIKTPMTQIVREAIHLRMADNPYTAGFNDGLNTAVDTVKGIQAAQMRFPSGKSFAELVEDEVLSKLMKESHETKRDEEPVPSV